MKRWTCLLCVVVLAVGSLQPARAVSSDQTLKPEEKAKMTVRLRLIDIEIQQLTRHYEREAAREINLNLSVDALRRKDEQNRTVEYEEALKACRQSMEATEK